MARYRLKCHCQVCGNVWTVYRDDPSKKPNKCPNKACKAVQTQPTFDLDSGRAPGIIGAKTIVKAVDLAAKIAMEDYHLTDLKDNIREGESMVPRIAPKLQQAADTMFGGGPAAKTASNRQQQAFMSKMMRRAVGGAYAASAADVKSILPDNRVAMRRYRTEALTNKN